MRMPTRRKFRNHRTNRSKQQRGGGSFLDSLAAKYGVDHAAGGPEPSEKAFAATAKRMKGRGKPKK